MPDPGHRVWQEFPVYEQCCHCRTIPLPRRLGTMTASTYPRPPLVPSFPLPGPGKERHAVAVPAPGRGPQHWAGAPSATLDADGTYVLAYRVRDGGEDHNAVARSTDGELFTTVAVLPRGRPSRLVGRPRRPADQRPARRPGLLRRAGLGGGELARTHRPGRTGRRNRGRRCAAAGAGGRAAGGRRPLPRRAPAARRQPPALLRGPAPRRQPRTAHRTGDVTGAVTGRPVGPAAALYNGGVNLDRAVCGTC